MSQLILISFIIIAALFVGIIILATRKQSFLRKHGIRASAHVVGHKEERDEGRSSFYPRVRFTAPNGESVEVTLAKGASLPQPPLGTQVEILHHPQDPRQAILAGPVQS
jgi:hypothetical protein